MDSNIFREKNIEQPFSEGVSQDSVIRPKLDDRINKNQSTEKYDQRTKNLKKNDQIIIRQIFH